MNAITLQVTRTGDIIIVACNQSMATLTTDTSLWHVSYDVISTVDNVKFTLNETETRY
jgi:hypothetical protein